MLFNVALVIAAAAEPVAVAPWQNLNRDDTLVWLEQGAAETMVADLRTAGVKVVERAQIVRALEQVAVSDDVGRAVAAGRIVGAKALVLGSFQRSGSELRLVARFVDVETGVVAETAKATGKLDEVFALQDRIVATLLKRSGKRPATPPRQKSNPKAYELYSKSLTTTDDSKARALLSESLQLDPQLVYARDALAALEQRMRRSADDAVAAFAERERALLSIVESTAETPERRRTAARKLLDELIAARRFRALRAAAERVLAAKLPADVLEDIDERASFARVLSLARLIQTDLAMQAGERHLATFAAGAHRAEVEKLVRDLVDERRSEPQRRREYDDELREVAELDGVARDFRPCIAAKWSRLPEEMINNCTRFLERHAKTTDPDAVGHVVSARAYVAWAHAMTGAFDRAWTLARALERDVPGALDDTGLRPLTETRWSTD